MMPFSAINTVLLSLIIVFGFWAMTKAYAGGRAKEAEISLANLAVVASETAYRMDKECLRQCQIILDQMPCIVWTADATGYLDYYNLRWYEYTGLTFQETKGWGWKSVIHPDDLPHCVEVWTHSVRTGQKYEVEYRFKDKDGEYRWHLGRAIRIPGSDRANAKWIGLSNDIHDQKSHELI